MEQLKDNPYFEKYKNKIKTAFEWVIIFLHESFK
jgi:hypothetical protein